MVTPIKATSERANPMAREHISGEMAHFIRDSLLRALDKALGYSLMMQETRIRAILKNKISLGFVKSFSPISTLTKA